MRLNLSLRLVPAAARLRRIRRDPRPAALAVVAPAREAAWDRPPTPCLGCGDPTRRAGRICRCCSVESARLAS